jgi:zinc transport system substrate-binding protein
MKKFIITALFLVLSASAAPALAESGLPVFVSILPQKYFVEKIGGEFVDVDVMVSPGSSPATYEPSPRQMAALSKAQAYFAIGVPFEKHWLPRIASANPDMPVIHTDKGIDKMPIGAHEHHDHEGEAHDDHGHEGKGHGHDKGHHHDGEEHDAHGHGDKGHGHDEGHHDHEGEAHAEHHGDAGHGHDHQGMPDPHVWLAPELVRIQAENIHDALARIDPGNAETYAKNFTAFIREIDRLNHEIEHILASLEDDQRTFMVFHPTWGYFARQYGLEQIAIEAGGKEPGPGKLAEIIKHGRELGIKTVFVQPQFSQKSAKVIARELNAEVVTLDPLAPDWNDNLIKAAKAFEQAATKSGN